MLNNIQKIIIAIQILVLSSCIAKKNELTVTVSNPTNKDRLVETVSVNLPDKLSKDDIIVLDKKSNKELLSQVIKGTNNTVLFQVTLKANESHEYIVKPGKSTIQKSKVKTYGRFVPERVDDFAWENDRVAFRVYGPEGQRLVFSKERGGVYSGGVDLWLKKVNYSIINGWYKGNTKEEGYYHKDHGEGLDNYEVGPSLGCGGTGVIIDNKLIRSENYTGHKVLTNGPIRTKFNLDYAPFGTDTKSIKQQKIASLDMGSNFTKFVINVKGTDVLTTGVVLEKDKGEINTDDNACWFDYWTPHFGTELGCAIIVDPKYYAGSPKLSVDKNGKDHMFVNLKVIDGKVEYYAGFAWSASKQFKNKEDWHQYLNKFSNQIKTPLVVKVN